jgi:Tol biopolymer transport system component
MKLKISLFLLTLICGAGFWLWGQSHDAVDNQVKGTQTKNDIGRPTELGLVWVTTGETGLGRVATVDAMNEAQMLTSASDDVRLACRINQTRLAYFVQDNGFYKLWLWMADQTNNKFIVATRQKPFELICDQLGNRIFYSAYDGSRRILYQVDVATNTTRLVDSVTGRAGIDQTGQHLVYPMAAGLFYREINLSGELSQPLRVVSGEAMAVTFTRSNNAIIYVLKEKNGYTIYQTDWRSQTTEQLNRFDIGRTDLEWSLDLSSDGKMILYRYVAKDASWQSTIGTVQIDGTGQQELQTGVGRTAWAPNEQLIVYEKLRFETDRILIDLWQMSAQGSDREVMAGTGRNYLTGYQLVDPMNSDLGQ